MLNFDRRFIWLLTLTLFFTSSTCVAQSTTPAPAPVSKSKSGQESCDGALDIVPSKSATFMRKRRPGNRKPTHKPEAKSESKSSS